MENILKICFTVFAIIYAIVGALIIGFFELIGLFFRWIYKLISIK